MILVTWPGMGVTKQPEKYSNQYPGSNLWRCGKRINAVEQPAFSRLMPEIATKITTNKINNVKKTGADIVAVECPLVCIGSRRY